MVKMILGIMAFAVVTAILYIWGLKKSIKQSQGLERQLMGVCANKVVKYIKKNGAITKKEIADIITGVKAGSIWSKKKIAVYDGNKVAPRVIKFLLEQQYITEVDGTYQLKR